jgi:hypothetical protein
MSVTIIAAAAALFAAYPGAAVTESVYQQCYLTQEGVYLAPRHQAGPNHNTDNTWSAAPDVDPYSRQEGPRQSSGDVNSSRRRRL